GTSRGWRSVRRLRLGALLPACRISAYLPTRTISRCLPANHTMPATILLTQVHECADCETGPDTKGIPSPSNRGASGTAIPERCSDQDPGLLRRWSRAGVAASPSEFETCSTPPGCGH